MKALSIADAPTVVLGLQDEIRRNAESRYNHRSHGLLLVAQGMSGLEVARLLGDSPRTVQYWVHRFEQDGLAGLLEGERPGRPRRLSERQLQEVNAALRSSPEESGLSGNLWDGKTLSAWALSKSNQLSAITHNDANPCPSSHAKHQRRQGTPG